MLGCLGALLKEKSNVDDARLAGGAHGKSTLREYLEHRCVIRQDLGAQLLEPGCSGDGDEVAQQRGADPLALVSVDDDEGQLRLPRTDDDVAAATDDDRAPLLLQRGDQGDVGDEVDIEKVGDLAFREAALRREEAAIEGFWAASADGCEQIFAVRGA